MNCVVISVIKYMLRMFCPLASSEACTDGQQAASVYFIGCDTARMLGLHCLSFFLQSAALAPAFSCAWVHPCVLAGTAAVRLVVSGDVCSCRTRPESMDGQVG